MAKAKAVKVKCIFSSCTRLVGPVRAKKAKMCYVCDRNLEDWRVKGQGRRMEWRRRVRMFGERLDSMPSTAHENTKVASFVEAQVKRNLRKAS